MTMMDAVAVYEHGGPEALVHKPIERPVPGEGEIMVRVGACALNALDLFVRNGMPGIRLPLPQVPGGDITGWVEVVGDSDGESLLGRPVLLDPLVINFRGRKGGVLGESCWGGLAQYVVAPTVNAIPLDGVDAVEMRRYAALPIAYATAHRMLFTRAKLKADETMVVLGAAGGVGVACVQLGSRAGARVVACSTSDNKLARLRALGAAETINTATEDFVARVKELTDGRGADLIVDYVGRDTWPKSILAAKGADLAISEGGRITTCGASSGFEAATDLRYVWARELTILGSNAWRRHDIESLVTMVQARELEPVIHGVFPLSRAQDALAVLEDRTVMGKVIVVPDEVMDG